MKKILIGLSLIFVLIACQVPAHYRSDDNDVISGIKYIKDDRTGLCFAILTSVSANTYIIISITCVPCDSLKKLGIK